MPRYPQNDFYLERVKMCQKIFYWLKKSLLPTFIVF